MHRCAVIVASDLCLGTPGSMLNCHINNLCGALAAIVARQYYDFSQGLCLLMLIIMSVLQRHFEQAVMILGNPLRSKESHEDLKNFGTNCENLTLLGLACHNLSNDCLQHLSPNLNSMANLRQKSACNCVLGSHRVA
jgi:hypothetical protein